MYAVANSETPIPVPTNNCRATTFRSASPPSISNGNMIFRGLDIEENQGDWTKTHTHESA